MRNAGEAGQTSNVVTHSHAVTHTRPTNLYDNKCMSGRKYVLVNEPGVGPKIYMTSL